MSEKITFTRWNDAEDESVEVSIPARYEVCDRCHGRGTHDHPAFSNGFTRDDDFVDDDFIEEYMAGTYDVPCSECHGNRVVLVPADGPDSQNPNVQAYYKRQRDEADYRREVAAERRMGA